MANKTVAFLCRQLARAAVFALLLCGISAGQAWAQDEGQKPQPNGADYQLGPLDSLRLKVVAWRASQGEVFEWNAINGEYTVNAGGKISIPLIGEIRASETTTVELADALAKRLQQRLNIAQTLNATIEIIKFRPFYIVGDVANSGEYSFRPGMTVIQAMSIAGGLPRSHAVDVHQIDRDVAGWTGELNQVTDEETMLRSQMEQQQQLLQLAQQDKQQVENKQKTGLVTEQRYMASQRDVATAQTELLRLKIRLQEIKHKIATNTVLISESNRIAPTWVGAALRFSIIRPSGSTFTEFPANETTLVAPGDTIKVKCCGSEDPKASLQSSLLGEVPQRR